MNPASMVLPLAIAALALVVGVALVTWAVTARRWRRLLRAADGRGLEALLIEQQRLLESLAGEVAATRAEHAGIVARLSRRVRRPGVVRYNAFAETGSDLSFALALLDDEGDGVVLSSIYGREESRVYAKPITAGASTYRLTEEEQEAIRRTWTP